MRNAILGAGALLAAGALAGCGGSGNAGGTVGVSTGKTSTTVTAQSGGASFDATANGLSTRIRTAVKQFEKGNLGAAASSGASLMASCKPTVNGKLAPKATTQMQQHAVADLRSACADMQKADTQAMGGNLSGAKNWAAQAYAQAKTATQDLR